VYSQPVACLVTFAVSFLVHLACFGAIMLVQKIEIWRERLPDRDDAIGSYFFHDYDCHKYGYLIGMPLLTVGLPSTIHRVYQDSMHETLWVVIFCLMMGTVMTAVITFVKAAKFAPSWDHDGPFPSWTGMTHAVYVALLIASGFFMVTMAVLEQNASMAFMPAIGFCIWWSSFRDDSRAGRFQTKT